MNHDENRTDEAGPPHILHYLLCDPAFRDDRPQLQETWIKRPIECLSNAVEANPDFVVIRFTGVSLNDRQPLVELIATLKKNRYTKKSKVVALMHFKQRKLLEDLHGAGSDFVKYVDDRSTPDNIMEILKGLGPNDRLQKQLAIVCPFLHYSEIDFKTELTACGAYLDRMILGGSRLHEVCETESHLHCEFYLNPRL